jgi:hypothetical protein
MALSNDLLQFLNKPSGVYRLTRDNSQTNVSGAAPTTPLIIGFSKKGLFNTPVFCPDTEFFVSIFGSGDRSLENQGSWFHRTALELLQVGPIIVLNLYNLKSDEPTNINATSLTDQNYDLTEYRALSAGYTNANQAKQKQVLTRLYNTTKFWFPDSKKLNDFASLSQTDALISFVNLSQKPITILTRKASVSGFKVTALEWFGSNDLPEFVRGEDYIEDFFIDVIVLNGDFTDYATLATDPIYGTFFDAASGLKVAQLQNFLRLPQVSVAAIYTGIIIPDFVDKNGQNLYIQTVINDDTARTGLLCAINEAFVADNVVSGDEFDLVGHNTFALWQEYLGGDAAANVVDYLSYSGEISEQYVSSGLDKVNMDAYLAVSGVSGEIIELTIPSTTTSAGFAALYSRVGDGEVNRGSNVSLNVIDGLSATATIVFEVLSSEIVGNDAIITFKAVDWTTNGIAFASVGINTAIPVYSITGLSATTLNGYLAITGSGTVVTVTIPRTGAPAAYQNIYDAAVLEKLAEDDELTVDFVDGIPTSATITLLLESYAFDISNNLILTFKDPDFVGAGLVYGSTVVDTGAGPFVYDGMSFTMYHNKESFVEFDVDTVLSTGYASNEIAVSSISYGVGRLAQIGGWVLSSYDGTESRMTRIKSIATIVGGFKITTDGPLLTHTRFGTPRLFYTQNINETFTAYSLTTLFGYRIKDRLLPNNTGSRMNEIYGVLSSTNIGNTLQNKTAITFRYLVDTFNHGIELNSKSVLTNLCMGRENAFAILNSPTMKEFAESSDPMFTNIPTTSVPRPDLNVQYIPTGGNLQSNPTFLYTLPSEIYGGAYGAFYAPNVLVRERGRLLEVPPAAYVAKLFIIKHTATQPWAIVAGNRRGVLGGNGIIGLSYRFDDTERGYLENFGINPIVIEEGVGLEIKGNSTAKQQIKSSLSSINGTEVLIYIQDRVAAVLKKFVWEFNTPEIRLEVKTLVDQELEQVRVDGGIFDYATIMNNNNNTGDVIDNLLGVIDTYIEIAKGMQKVIHRTTILKTGQIATGIL